MTSTIPLRVLGDYAVIKQIGQGSLGTVYLAEHRFMKRHYAIKVLPEELASDRSFIARFEEEVKLLASLDHPNIVKIHNISFADGAYFLVTDCVVDQIGETTHLVQFLADREERLPEQELLRLLKPLAEALDYAHGKQMGGLKAAHRGIKPNNILIGKGKSNAKELFLSDFGLSRIVGPSLVLARTYKVLADALGIVTVLQAAGKPGNEWYPPTPPDSAKFSVLQASFVQNYSFLAPEQKRFDKLTPVDAKADVYAFGVLIYYMITGECPEGIFEPIAVKAPEYTLNWDNLLQHCLQNNPAKRPALLVEAMDHFLQQKEEAVPQPAAEEKKEAMIESPSLENPLRPVNMSVAALMQRETTVTHYEPEPKEDALIEPILTDKVAIRGGAFYRGSNNGNRDEMPRHRIQLHSFAVDIHPVTNEQFVRFLEAIGGEKDAQNHDVIRLRESRIRRSNGRLGIESGYSKHPVVGVTWYGAVAYAKWVGKRLPTEAEWEIAAGGGRDEEVYPTGEEIEKSQANFFSSDTTAVMSYAPNGFGLYDIAGNVYEWCQDWYDYNYYAVSAQEPDNPKGPLQGVYRVLRGGCWKSLKEDLRCSHRHRNNPGTVNRTYGFRCVSNAN